MKTTKIILSFAAAVLAFASCNDFLDTMPDNRAELDSPKKVKAMLGSAYSFTDYQMVTELLSDNCDNNAAVVSSAPDRFFDEVWAWKDVVESNNESPENIWGSNWSAIAAANQALEAIAELGGPENPELAGSYGEALIARAYGHFTLVNIFCMHYNAQTAATDQGIPYMEAPEKGLNPQYERGNVADVYEKIERDIEEGLKYVGDEYDVPKYHFNRQAALAFATRFYLYYGKYQRAIECANECLGAAPETMLRDYADLQANYVEIGTARAAYNSSDQKCNLLLQTGYSNQGLFWGNYSGSYKYYGFTGNIANTESFMAPTPWSNGNLLTATSFKWRPRTYNSGALQYIIFWKIDYEFEYTDPVAGIGYRRTVYPAFTTDECLLNRAEAYILSNQFDKACEDLNIWCNNFYTASINLTPESIKDFYDGMDYYEWNAPTPKKHLQPKFEWAGEGSIQEALLHFVLNLRRTETMGLGQRWFDIKRYGITVYRRVVNGLAQVEKITDTLEPDDLRRAVQVPQKSRDAGFEANKR
ncbi:MAG: RagB/SusD family nutrient uptake outer membrane protein [Bacteroidales bacterium]|nr:RagB/SusD family nutrient uptake outer membrane protein [Bacteroidales bacterium]